ncbi:MAG: hypothetical protein Tsb005_06250 [Gammaproteobacteria bacterium]
MDQQYRLYYLQQLDIQSWCERVATSNNAAVLASSEMGNHELQTKILQDGNDKDFTQSWEKLRAQVAQCTACSLHQSRTQTVFGVGCRQADLLIVGEAPGANEDRLGEPFVGRAGKLLDAMLATIGLDRSHVYIANVLKCRPPQNRDPLPTEIAQCTPFLEQQVALLQPKLILAVGRYAAHYLLETNLALGKLRNQIHTFRNTNVPLIVSYHPAYLLRSPRDKAKALLDLYQAQQILRRVA